MAVDLHGWRTKHGFTQAEAAGMLACRRHIYPCWKVRQPATHQVISEPVAGTGRTRGHRILWNRRVVPAAIGRAGLPRLPALAGTPPSRGPGDPAFACLEAAGPGCPRVRGPSVGHAAILRPGGLGMVGAQSKLHDFQSSWPPAGLGGRAEPADGAGEVRTGGGAPVGGGDFCWDSMPEATRVWMRRNVRRKRRTGMW